MQVCERGLTAAASKTKIDLPALLIGYKGSSVPMKDGVIFTIKSCNE